VRILRVLLGAGLALLLLAGLWYAGLVDPPEGLRRRIVGFATVYPGPTGRAVVAGIPCPVLRRSALYVVCTENCEGIWRIVAIRGLHVEALSDLHSVPPEPRSETRRRFNRLVMEEGLRLDAGGARELVGCLLRLDGMDPAYLLEDKDVETIDAARDNAPALQSLAETIKAQDGLERVEVSQAGDGFEARVLYWNLDRTWWPVQEIRFGLARDGRILWLKRRELPVTDGTGSDNTPGTPPT